MHRSDGTRSTVFAGRIQRRHGRRTLPAAYRPAGLARATGREPTAEASPLQRRRRRRPSTTTIKRSRDAIKGATISCFDKTPREQESRERARQDDSRGVMAGMRPRRGRPADGERTRERERARGEERKKEKRGIHCTTSATERREASLCSPRRLGTTLHGPHRLNESWLLRDPLNSKLPTRDKRRGDT